MGSTKTMFTVRQDRVAYANAFDVENAHVGEVLSGQFQATIPLLGLIPHE